MIMLKHSVFTLALAALLVLLTSVPAFADDPVASCPAPKGSPFEANKVAIQLRLISYFYPNDARAAAADLNQDGYVCVVLRNDQTTVAAFFDNTLPG